jgi:hypothetical protein
MGAVLRKTSYSANIKERRDYSCAVYDASGETVAMGDHMPVHLGAMPLSVWHAMQALDFAPGDVAILNDPFRGGTHLPDITAVSGVFVKGNSKPAFYVANRAHHADVGGMSPGSMPLAREIYQEGIRIPPILLARRGKFDRELLGLILANVRTPEEREGDLLAQCMAIRRGEQRLLELVAKYGMAKVRHNMTALKDYSERMIRSAIRRLPRGKYRFEDALDSDGIVDGPVKIAVCVTIHGDRAGGRVSECELCGGDCRDHLCISVPGEGRYSVYGWCDAAAYRDCSRAYGGERDAAGCDGCGQCGNIATNYRRSAGGAGAGCAGTDSGGEFGHHEQHHFRRDGSFSRTPVCLLRDHRGRHGCLGNL